MKRKIKNRVSTLLGDPVMCLEVSEDMMETLYIDAKRKFKFYSKLRNKKFKSIKNFWIENYFQANVKESLAHIRGKFKGMLPIPGADMSLEFKKILKESQDEKKHLILLLNEK